MQVTIEELEKDYNQTLISQRIRSLRIKKNNECKEGIQQYEKELKSFNKDPAVVNTIQKRITGLKKNIRSQEQVSKLLGISKEQYYKIENGKAAVTSKQLFILCKIYEVSADFILGFSDLPNHPDNDNYNYLIIKSLISEQKTELEKISRSISDAIDTFKAYQSEVSRQIDELKEIQLENSENDF